MADIEELVDTVLVGQHPKMRERCLVDRIVTVFEDSFGAYDIAGVKALLADQTRLSRSEPLFLEPRADERRASRIGRGA